MKKDTNLIYYPAGCYGTFVEWICQHFYSELELDELPFMKDGSSHKYSGNVLLPVNPVLNEYLKSNHTVKFARITTTSIYKEINSQERLQENTWSDIVREDLNFLDTHFNKIIVLYPTVSSKLWLHNNVIDKCILTDDEFKTYYEPYGYTRNFFRISLTTDPIKKLKETIKKELDLDKSNYWGKNSIDELEYWELRELLSVYWFNRDKDLYTCWKQLSRNFNNILFVSINELKNNPIASIKLIFNFFNIDNYNHTDIQNILSQWEKLQIHKDKDSTVDLIIQSVLEDVYYDWANTNLSILDEAYIQRQLRENNVEIKCFNLNKFPTNTKLFKNIIV